MTITEARRIIESLAEALRMAAEVLERLQRSEQRQQNLAERAGEAWDSAEEGQLRAEVDAGKSVAEIARIHQRKAGAIQSRLLRLGILPQR